MKKPIGRRNAHNRLVWIKKRLGQLPPGSNILDVGAGECRYKKFCQHLKYVSQDFCQYKANNTPAGLQRKTWDQSKIDITSDILAIPRPDASFDAVMCLEVLEHVPEPAAALKEMGRLLRAGGKLLLTAPFGCLTHYAPFFHYTGFSRYFYEHYLPQCGFAIVELCFNGNYYEYMAQELRRLFTIAPRYSRAKLSAGERKSINEAVGLLSRLDKSDTGSSELLCHGLHVVAVKGK